MITLVETDFAARRIRFQLVVKGGHGLAQADPRALHQVLLNLFSNAADALVDSEHPEIVISVAETLGRVEIRVRDNGVGLDEAKLANFFKPFYTSKPHGTGLGLVIVKKLMSKMGGTIAFESQPEVGTTAILTLASVSSETGGRKG